MMAIPATIDRRSPRRKPSVDNIFNRAPNVREELGAGKNSESQFVNRLNPKLHLFNLGVYFCKQRVASPLMLKVSLMFHVS